MQITLPDEVAKALAAATASDPTQAEPLAASLIVDGLDAMIRLAKALKRPPALVEVPAGATHIVFHCRAGDSGAAPEHASDPVPVEDLADDDGTIAENELSDYSDVHMSESIQPNAWWTFIDANGDEVE